MSKLSNTVKVKSSKSRTKGKKPVTLETLMQEKMQDVTAPTLTQWEIKRKSVWRRFSSFWATSVAGSNMVGASGKDPGKKQRIGIVAFLIVLFVFGLKLWGGQGEWGIWESFGVAGIASIIAYVGLAWGFRFDVSKKAYATVLPQPTLFVFASVLFTELFFFQKFQRVFESITFGLLLLIIVAAYYFVFLTANILNVGTIKEIPLMKAAQTASYVVALGTIYFSTFALIATGINVIALVPILLIIYYLTAYFHLSNFPLSKSEIIDFSLAVSMSALLVVLSLFVWPVDLLFVPLLPTAVVYVGLGFSMHHTTKTFDQRVLLEYVSILVAIGLIVLFRAKWGVGGSFWM